MARVRLGGILADEVPRLRLGGISTTSPAATSGRLRLGGISAAGSAGVVLLPLTDVTVEPSTVVNKTAALAPGSATPDSYSWSVVSGRPVLINGTGQSVAITSPVCAPGSGLGPTAAFTVIQVRGIIGGVPSSPQQFRIDSPPQLDWLYTATGLAPLAPTAYAP